MSDNIPPRPRKRGNPNMRVGAPSVNPSGKRAALGKTFAQLIDEQIGDEELIRFAVEAVRDPATPWKERVALHGYLTRRKHGSEPQSLDINVGVNRPDALPHNWTTLSQSERGQYLDRVMYQLPDGQSELQDSDDDLVDVEDAEIVG